MTQTVVFGRPERPPILSRRAAIVAGVIAAVALVGLLAFGIATLASARAMSGAINAELSRAHAPAGVVEFYERNGYRPLWADAPPWRVWRKRGLRPEAAQVAELADSRRLTATVAGARGGALGDLARAEVALSLALGDYARSLRRTSSGVQLAFVDPDLQTPAEAGSALDQAAAAASLSAHLRALRQVNPVHDALRQGLVAYRAAWSRLPQIQVSNGAGAALRVRLGLPPGASDDSLRGAVLRFQAAHGLAQTGAADGVTVVALNAGPAPYERLILANLERARVLPPAGRRFVLVNAAAQELSLYEDGRAVDTMRVVVGTREEPTPMMAGLLRYVVYNPYWYMPADMVRENVAPRVVASGTAYLQKARLETLSDWTEDAYRIDPAQVDWTAVAAGGADQRVRQQPGGDNMMGRMKFMLPNELGIYLHDTPNRAAFQAADRRISAGCVRVERPDDLAAWLLGRRRPQPASVGADHHVDLDAPAPVYITYLTAAPGRDGVVFHPDVYGRDPALLAALQRGGRRAGA